MPSRSLDPYQDDRWLFGRDPHPHDEDQSRRDPHDECLPPVEAARRDVEVDG